MGLIVDMIFPRQCVGCKKFGKYICDNCANSLSVIGSDYKNKQIEGKISLFKYDGAIKDIIGLIKFEFVYNATFEIGNLMTNNLLKYYPNIVSYWQENKFTIISVPLHWKRKNWRGFNQAELIGKTLANNLKLSINNNLIKRSINTKKQSTSNKIERLKNVRGAFRVIENLPKNIILVDDVWTTGETIKNIVKIIPKNSKIWVLTLASGR